MLTTDSDISLLVISRVLNLYDKSSTLTKGLAFWYSHILIYQLFSWVWNYVLARKAQHFVQPILPLLDVLLGIVAHFGYRAGQTSTALVSNMYCFTIKYLYILVFSIFAFAHNTQKFLVKVNIHSTPSNIAQQHPTWGVTHIHPYN